MPAQIGNSESRAPAVAMVVPVNDRCLALMLTAMKNVPLRGLVIALASALVIFAAFAAGIGVYAVALAWWPLVLVWWHWLLAGAVAVVALGGLVVVVAAAEAAG